MATKKTLLETPTYPVSEAAGFLYLPSATLRSWVRGRDYRTAKGVARFDPLIEIAAGEPALLSFLNVAEAHVLSAIRRTHGISFPRVRKALDFVEREFRSRHPLIEKEFLTDGVDLFVQGLGGEYVLASGGKQQALRGILTAHLERIERSPKGVPIRLYPFTRFSGNEEPRPVTIDPAVSFGRPVLTGTGIPTDVIVERFNEGESIHDLAHDYGRNDAEIEEAIRFECHQDAA